jgi:uncharacterized protein YbjT (DUF2867 family)
MRAVLVTGASGNVGSLVVQQLRSRGYTVRAAVRRDGPLPQNRQFEEVIFDFVRPGTWDAALSGVHGVFLMRPPHISNIPRDMEPFLRRLADYPGIHTVFMSVQGAEVNTWVPHHKIEQLCTALGLSTTIVRPSFFMQNLTTTHLPEIRDDDRIFVPAGGGRTSFVDAADVAACVVEIFDRPELQGRAHTITGSNSCSYADIARHLSRELEKPIRYTNPGPIRFLSYHLRRGRPLGMSIVMLVLYSIVRFGKGDITTEDTRRILQRDPASLETFLHSHRDLFLPVQPDSTPGTGA